MSGRLTILPKKTYCPWNPANVERVLRDERLERERLEKEHSLVHEKERSKKRQRRREDESEGQHEQQQGHINLFPEAVKQANGSTTGTSATTIINPGSETNGVLAVPLGGEEANNRKYGKLPFYMRPSPVGGESRDVDDYENNEVVAKNNAQHAIRNGVFRGGSTSSNAVTGDVITSAIMADQYRHREESRKQKTDPTTRFMSSSKNNHTQQQPQIQQKPGGAVATNEAVISQQATTHNLDKETHGSKSHFRRKRSRSRGHDGSENKKSKKRYHRGREDRGGSPLLYSDDGNDVASSSSSLSDNNSSTASSSSSLSSSSSDRRSHHHHHRSSRTKHKKQKSLKKCARKSHSKQQHESPSLRSKEDHHQRKKEKDKRKKRRHGRDESGNSAKDRSKRRRRGRHSSERSLKYEGCENNDDQRFVQNGNGPLSADEISNDTRKKVGELEELRRRRHAREAREMERERQVLMPSGGIL